jgi:hypothetical protein
VGLSPGESCFQVCPDLARDERHPTADSTLIRPESLVS